MSTEAELESRCEYCFEPFDEHFDCACPGGMCRYCQGTGGDPWNDYILACPECGGDGECL